MAALQGAAIVVLFVSAAVAFESPSLVEVKDGAGELRGSKRQVQPFGAQLIRVQSLKCLASWLFYREEAVLDQQPLHARLALKQPVAAPSHGASGAASDGQRGAVFRVAAIREDAYASANDRAWLGLAIEQHHRPAKRR
jgi:hypothetical protein